MKIEKKELRPVQQQGCWEDALNEWLRGSIHVEMFTKEEPDRSGDRTLVVFALFN